MKFSVRVCAAVALAVLSVASAAFLSRRPDPTYQERLASEWAQDLLSSDYKIRGEAETALKAVGEPAVPQLCALLQRRNAAWKKPLVRFQKFLPFLNDRDIDANRARTRAAEMLGSLGSKAHSAVPDLVASLACEHSAAEAERALIRIGDVSISFLEHGLKSRKTAVRERSARLLRAFSPARATSIRVLISATRDDAAPVRKEAARSLGKTLSISRCELIAAERPSAFPPLLKLTGDKDFQVRAAAFEALGQLGDATPEVLNVLNAGLEDLEPISQLQAAKSLWALNQDAAKLIPVLTRILGTSERWQAAYALGEMGSCASAAVPALAQLLSEERVPRPFRTPPSAALALGKIGAAAVPAVLPLLENSDARVRMNALMAFGFMGTAGRAAVPELIKHLQDENFEVRHATALTLATIGAEPGVIVAGLSDCLGAEDIYMRSAAAAILRQIAPEGNWNAQAE